MRTSLLSTAALALMISCAPAINIHTDYNHQVDLARYKTFSIREGTSSGNPVMDARIRSDIESALRARGLEEVASGEGQAIVVPHVATRTRHSYSTFYDGWGWRWRWAEPQVVVSEFRVGTIVVDVFDAATKTAIWHGYTSQVISDNPAKNAQRADKAVSELFERYPFV